MYLSIFYYHFLHVGVGFRQICDWALMLNHYQLEIDWEKQHRRLKETDTLDTWNAFSLFTNQILDFH